MYQKITTRAARHAFKEWLPALGLLALPVLAQSQGLGVATLGATGGLTIPSAYVLGSGEMALSLGNYVDPRLGSFSRTQNYTLGFGLVLLATLITAVVSLAVLTRLVRATFPAM